MKKTILLVLLTFIGLSTANAQVGIGTTTPDPSAKLDVTSTDKGFLPPRLTTVERDAITSPAEGLTIYNTDNKCIEFWNNTLWASPCDRSAQPGSPSDCSTPGFIPPFLTADQTQVVDVTNPITGDTWMDRNLGAYTADRSAPGSAGGTDCWAYGNLYQWGRNSDGHESRLLDCSTSECFNAAGVSSSLPATPANVTNSTWAGKFIFNMPPPFDWHQANPNNTLWTSTGGTNNPCPTGYRVPTEAEWEAEWDSWDGSFDNVPPPPSFFNREDALDSPLKLPVPGVRFRATGVVNNVGALGIYWSSTASGSDAWYFGFNDMFAEIIESNRANGYSVRCIKN